MIKPILALAALTMAASLAAQTPTPTMTPDQKGYIAYHYCMMQAAIEASKTPAKDNDIFAISQARCATTRKAVVVGQESNTAFLAALDDADADKKVNFPAWIKGVRERRAAAAAPVGK